METKERLSIREAFIDFVLSEIQAQGILDLDKHPEKEDKLDLILSTAFQRLKKTKFDRYRD